MPGARLRPHMVMRASLVVIAVALLAMSVVVFVIGANASAGTADSTNLYLVAFVLLGVAVGLVWVLRQLARR